MDCMTATRRITPALKAALGAVTVEPADQAAVRLAQRYAADLDDGGDLAKLGPQLLAVLESLGMTRRARAALVKGAMIREPAASPLDELRQRRRARADRAAAVDASAS
jgi:hypothetical protein